MERMRPRLLLCLLSLVLMAPALAAAVSPRADDATAPPPAGPAWAPGRLLVKLTPDAVRGATLNLSQEKGAASRDARTGLVSLDALGRDAGLRRIVRPYAAPARAELAASIGVDRWLMLEVDDGADIPALAARYAADPHVEAASPDWQAFPAAVPTDPLYASHWGHNNTAQLLSYNWTTHTHEAGSPVGTVGFDANAQAAWDGTQGYGDAGVVIAIIDSGVDIDHPDLRLVTGYDYGDNDSNPDDNSSQAGHGTCCAGVAAAKVNNGLGANGIAAGCSVMPLKVANSAGSMYFSAIQNALYYAADNGAEVISMSLGAAISSDAATDNAILYAYNAGCTILAATGNENNSTISYPAINAYVIGVGAASPCGERKRSSSLSTEVNPGVSTDPNGYTCDGERWWGSNYGSTTRDAAGAVDVIAPTILPTTDIGGAGGYTSTDYEMWFNGTSCATPYAAGVCALIKSKNPTWTPAQIRAQLVNTAQDVTSVESGAGWDRYAGYGMVDAAAAVGGGTPANTVTLTAPNGGESLAGGSSFTITWTSTGTIANVKLEYSTNGGSNYTIITASTPNDGSHAWTVPATATTQGRVRVSDAADAAVNDVSNANFTITTPAAYAALPYSFGFEGGAFDQYWATKSSGTTGRIQLTTANTPHSGSYHLTMDVSTSGAYVQNEAWLRLNLAGLGQVALSFWWKDIGDETHTQDGVFFSGDGGATFVKVHDLPGGTTTNNVWYLRELDLDALAASAGLALTSTFVVKFQQYDNYPITSDGMCFDDVAVTAVAAPTVTLTAPNGGENLTAGASTNITWTSTGTLANVKLESSTDAGSTWTTIIASTPNDGSHAWTVPATATTQGRVRVSDATNAAVNDISNANFTITVPAGGYATLPYATGFETGALDAYWTKKSSTTAGRVLITTANAPHAGSYHMTMDVSTSGTYVQNEAWLKLNLTGQTQVALSFWWKDIGDETHTQDGVFFSSDGGVTFVKVHDLPGGSTTNNVWYQRNLDLDALAASAGLALTGTFVVKFQQYDNYPITSDGMAFDDVSVTAVSGGATYITAETEPNASSAAANGPVGTGVNVTGAISSSTDDDWFYFDVATAGTINISLQIGSSADLDWFLYNASLTEVARGYTTSNPEVGSYSAAAGRYYLFVDGYSGATASYTLSVTGGLAKYLNVPPSPKEVALHPNFPNPFNPQTTIRFDLPREADVRLRVLDVRGRVVATLADGRLPAGFHRVVWDGRADAGGRTASGVYFYRLETGDRVLTRKLMLVQ